MHTDLGMVGKLVMVVEFLRTQIEWRLYGEGTAMQ
jgi:hypothetical protein